MARHLTSHTIDGHLIKKHGTGWAVFTVCGREHEVVCGGFESEGDAEKLFRERGAGRPRVKGVAMAVGIE